MTTAWIDVRDCEAAKLDAVLDAAIEHKIEAAVFDPGSKEKIGGRRPGIQWVAIEKSGNGCDAPDSEADVCVYARDAVKRSGF
jgi:hypothetical protein